MPEIGNLKETGYEEVELLDAADGPFLSKKEAVMLCLSGSKLLVGRKQKGESYMLLSKIIQGKFDAIWQMGMMI